MGTHKWIDVHLYTDLEKCMERVKNEYESLFSTYLEENSKSIYELDLSRSVALLFGNEHNGLSEEILQYSDGNFLIPQYGMAKSLNISVACAVSLYEALRQREIKGRYEHKHLSPTQYEHLVQDYIGRHESAHQGKIIKKKKK